MANTTWKQIVYDVADAYREADGSTAKIPVGQLADKVREGAGVPYTGENPLTLGQDGYTFPAKTLLKNGLQIVNGVNGEDLTAEVAEQTEAANALMRMVSRKIAMNNGEGQYVWKKCTRYTVNLTQTTSGSSPTTFKVTGQVTTDGIEVDFTDVSCIVGLTFADNFGHHLKFLTETTVKHLNADGTTKEYTYTWNSANSTVQIPFSWGQVHEFTEEAVLNVVNFVVSTSEADYPNGGEQDGYWYELVKEGVSGIDYGTVTISGGVTESVTIKHNLGTNPKWGGLVPAGAFSSVKSMSSININGVNMNTTSSGTIKLTSNAGTMDNSQAVFKSAYSFPFTSGTYYWFVVA